MFLLEAQVMQASDATTALRQLYFIVQHMLMNPTDTARGRQRSIGSTIWRCCAVCENRQMLDGLAAIDDLVGANRYYEALKRIRALLPVEQAILSGACDRCPIRSCLTPERQMNVNSATDTNRTQSTSNSSDATKSTSTVDYNTFLQLLIAEMQNQDPTNPMDTSQYMSQFAQLSWVEQAMQTNSKLDALLSSSVAVAG